MGGKSMKDVGGAGFAGSSPSFLGRERAAVGVDVGPERRSPRYHETSQSSNTTQLSLPHTFSLSLSLSRGFVFNLIRARANTFDA